METIFPPTWGMKRPHIRKIAESAGNFDKPKGRYFFCLLKSARVPIPLPIKYSIIAAKLFPIQETKIPTTGPNTAPLSITMGSVGMGVADSMPIRSMENSGPAIPVVGILFSIAMKSLRKKIISPMGRPKVIRTSNVFLMKTQDFFGINMFIIKVY
ncbi:MAG: hypothetical protein UW80_C0011G0004 [Microgenomates group bacterium GW2011_GWC1_44_9]|nr:MAG: hypothetical protein UW80_C0011G0004 [Microgenomates group bacterium GW2011_GWC1_44_9]